MSVSPRVRRQEPELRREDTAIHLEGVTCTYPGAVTPALRGMDLAIRPGEFFSILGPSGSGKTTALRVIAGFERVQAGTVSIGGRVVGTPRRHEPADKRNVGVVFQDYALFPHIDVLGNIAFGLRSAPRDRWGEHVQALVRMAGLEGLEARFPHELSGGQQQRVAVARALAPNPVAILLDEPFSNLDRRLRAQLRREVRALISNIRATAVLVTHDREEALAMADRVAVLSDGRVLQADTPEALYERPATPLVAQMAGPCDLLPGRIAGDRVETEAGAFPCERAMGNPVDGAPVLALVRSHELTLERAGRPGDGGREARVVYHEFGGDSIEYDLRLASGAVLRLRQASDAHFEPGATVRLAVLPGRRVKVFDTSAT
ncbi:MAG: ABC transporter ATP-binding protein [SAR202 cluster bacterium]|nr:ABC transporter ATP-binding protein [SAR202 cluster bacterium]